LDDNINKNKNVVMEEQVADCAQSLLLGFGEEDVDDEGFTPFLSRKTKKMKYACKIQRSLEKNRQRKRDMGAQVGFGATQEKVNNDHPVCGIVTASRIRKKSPNIYDRCQLELYRCGEERYEHFLVRLYQRTTV
jgi:hypothetical protein